MTPRTVFDHIHRLCHELDGGLPLSRRLGQVAIPAAIAVGAGAGVGCNALFCATLYGAPEQPPEICSDGIDNDGNGQVDCSDPSCAGDPSCEVEPTPSVYGAPLPLDSPDPHQQNQPLRPDPNDMVPEYGAPFPGPANPTPTPQQLQQPQPQKQPPQPIAPAPAYGAPFPGGGPSASGQ